MNIKDIRLQNTRWLAEKCGGNAAFGEKIGKSNSQISQIIGKNPTKAIGHSLAKQIAEAFNKPDGWMDTLHNSGEAKNEFMALGNNVKKRREQLGLTQTELAKIVGVSQVAISNLENRDSKSSRNVTKLIDGLQCTIEELESGNFDKSSFKKSDSSNLGYKEKIIAIPLYNQDFGMGGGVIDINQDVQHIANFETNKVWIRNNLKQASNVDNIRLITGRGDSMSPEICDGSAVFIDIGVTSYTGDGVYAIKVTNTDELLIKRIQRLLNGDFRVISDNDKYLPETIQKLEILGRVLGWMTFKDSQ